MAVPPANAVSMIDTLDGYMEAFNDNDLDRVMTFFAEDAVYRPGNGAERVGRAAIREELEPQFELAFGAMRFDECDRLIDERSRKIAIRYTCRHDLSHAKSKSLAGRIRRVLVGAVVGDRFGWEGTDVFHFDEAGKIKLKCTYAGYTQPRLERKLGEPLAAPAHADDRRRQADRAEER